MESLLAAKITIPAVKITGDCAGVVASLENASAAEDHVASTIPEPVPSTTIGDADDSWSDMDDLWPVTLDPIDSSLLPDTSSGVALEDCDLGEFLLDAVDWL